MRVVAHRAIALLMVLAFLAGGLAQLVPNAMAAQTCAMAMTTSDDDSSSGSQANGLAPICVDGSGCIIAQFLPAAFTPSFVPLDWSPIEYLRSSPNVSGIVVEPEYSPPITLA